MTIKKALFMVGVEYEKALKLEYVKNPLAFALYKVWKRADEGTMWNINATPPTNADHIRGMTDEELADLLEGERGNMLPGTALKWLQQPYKEDDHDQ